MLNINEDNILRKETITYLDYEINSMKHRLYLNNLQTESQPYWGIGSDDVWYGCIFKKDNDFLPYFGPRGNQDRNFQADWFGQPEKNFKDCLLQLMKNQTEINGIQFKAPIAITTISYHTIATLP